MNKLFIIAFILLFFISILFTFIVPHYLNSNLKEVNFDYQHTKAICEGNKCQDFLVTCKKGEVLEMNPISGFVTFSSDWQDARENKDLC